MTQDRREFIQKTTAMLAISAGLSACRWGTKPPPPPADDYLAIDDQGSGLNLIDAHAHTFNATDLPAVRFIKIVFGKLYPSAKETPTASGVIDPDFIDGLIDIFVHVIAGKGTPTAEKELSYLPDPRARVAGKHAPESPQAHGAPSPDISFPDKRAAARRQVEADYIAALDTYLGGSLETPMTEERERERAKGRHVILDAAEPSSGFEAAGSTGARALRAQSLAGRMLRWFGLFRRYRFQLVEDLSVRHGADAASVKFVAPALIDYSAWLNEDVSSPLSDQIKVMERISGLSTGVMVHAYAPFDPLREIYWRYSREQMKDKLHLADQPFQLVKEAILTRGFIGVKLYPPMGFRPSGNKGSNDKYPPYVPEKFATPKGDRPTGELLDDVLGELYSFCQKEGASILAHGDVGNAGGPGYDKRGDPANWISVFETWPDLRICLAHFGRFGAVSADAPVSSKKPDNSWEWTFGRWILKHEPPGAGARRFMDLSYLADVLGSNNAALDQHAADIMRFVSEFDWDHRHLVFGTDWMMLGKEEGSERFDSLLFRFLKDRCKFSDQHLRRVCVDNPREFLGLTPASKTYNRLITFYGDSGGAGRLDKLIAL